MDDLNQLQSLLNDISGDLRKHSLLLKTLDAQQLSHDNQVTLEDRQKIEEEDAGDRQNSEEEDAEDRQKIEEEDAEDRQNSKEEDEFLDESYLRELEKEFAEYYNRMYEDNIEKGDCINWSKISNYSTYLTYEVFLHNKFSKDFKVSSHGMSKTEYISSQLNKIRKSIRARCGRGKGVGFSPVTRYYFTTPINECLEKFQGSEVSKEAIDTLRRNVHREPSFRIENYAIFLDNLLDNIQEALVQENNTYYDKSAQAFTKLKNIKSIILCALVKKQTNETNFVSSYNALTKVCSYGRRFFTNMNGEKWKENNVEVMQKELFERVRDVNIASLGFLQPGHFKFDMLWYFDTDGLHGLHRVLEAIREMETKYTTLFKNTTVEELKLSSSEVYSSEDE
jgi:hypothetical protein